MPDTQLIHHSATPPRQPNQSYDDVLLNRYRIMNERATGGFGTVLTCWDTRLQRRVAIKRLPLASSTTTANAGAASTLQEALTEARTSSMLAHPNIVTVFDFEVEGSCAYMIMEFVDGLTLAELLQRVEGGVLTRDEAACLVQSVASALGYAHENGVLHLDIKPTNIMIDHAGTVKLCDFGMATLASAAGYGGARGGTVGYMPPEQIEGDIVDERSDVFSLAVVIWQSLFGASPFAAPTAEKSLALINKGPGKPSKLDPALAGMAEEALLGALAPSPAARIPSVETLAKELVFALGDPLAGAASLKGLLSQAQGGAADDPGDWEGERLPLGISHPWVPGVFARLVAALSTIPCAQALARVLLHTQGPTSWFAAAACAALTALWPPLGSAAVSLCFCLAVLRQATTAAPMLLAIVAALVFVIWWGTCGLRSPLATPALLLPCCMGSPIAGATLAGFALPPAAAAATACLSWVVGRIWPPTLLVGFALDGTVEGLLASMVTPGQLVSLVGCVFAAAITAALTSRGPAVAYALGGQTLGCVVLVALQLVAARMENGGIWADPSWSNAGVAVLLSALACAACVMQGPRDEAYGE